jgi:serine protease
MDHRFSATRLAGALASLLVVAACSEQAANPVAPSSRTSVQDPSVSFSRASGRSEALENAFIHPTVEAAALLHAFRHGGGGSNNLFYHGGVSGMGVETTPSVYVIFYGSQWSNDPSGEAALVESFLSGVGGSSWLNSVTQYCEGVASGTITCGSAGTRAGNPTGILAGVWSDNGAAAPSSPTQSQLAAEAVAAATHFGNTTQASNASAQYVIATSTGHNSSGFGTQYCAYHSTASSSFGYVAYTNLPYITDAGASCGANFNGLGANAGITIVEGHEMAETITDQFPNVGWLDSRGGENGDKCAWISSGQGASAFVTISTGVFPVQSLWSNAFNSGSGGCVLSY